MTNLDDDIVQVLPFDCDDGNDLDVALDNVRARFGSVAVTRAVLLAYLGWSVPMLPD